MEHGLPLRQRRRARGDFHVFRRRRECQTVRSRQKTAALDYIRLSSDRRHIPTSRVDIQQYQMILTAKLRLGSFQIIHEIYMATVLKILGG